MPALFLSSPVVGGGAEPPGPRGARPEDRLREAEGDVWFNLNGILSS
jgi:hypothetical protein